MLKTKSKILLVVFLALVLVSSYCFATEEPSTTEEQTTSETEVTAISETEDEAITTSEEDESTSWTNSDLYVCKDKVEVSNVVDGNAYIIGKEVTITGEIGGDLFVMAEKLNIEGGYIYSNLFACANEVNINGVVYDVYAAANTFNLQNDGFVYRDMRVTANNVNLNGKVRRNAFVSANNISFAENASTIIYGNLTYSSNTEITIPEGVVSGTTTHNKVNVSDNKSSIASTILSYVLDLFKALLYTLVITLILLWLAPKFIEKVSKMNVGKSFASLGIGFGAFIAFFVFIFIGIFLLISVVGTPVFVLGMFASILVGYLGNAIASIFFGKLFTRLLKMEGKVKFVLFTLVSSLIIWAISYIPFIGGFLSFLIWLFGIGTLIVNIFNSKKAIEEKTEIKE